MMPTLELVLGDRVALIAGNKAYRGVVDFDENRGAGSQWYIKLEVVEKGEPSEVQILRLNEPTA
jgi:hypothetical protein